ncbi:putative (E)-4-hydroxy-3-methylbut-2-enyl-diphosphate synthase (ferredoxin) [Helianthus annuus]|uniref:(E)-4-hydroxy-3-methylbut-2-enyl-diphosphate synthase (Ferredoxin) n=1 Tax=Helianthus annuus TaxID=4232 RepID=A0A9K3EJ05_HELAN|nr:putative (E)-4-hydroxy-3-methylbut-2-enyl-diphosphate synthase (ferredoxin) [Helianthus annuus]KAJ0477531.1 putative (E)-4-hydroxy-3-methylbut-2-enyl-diphosphate synthase (ferredoxin) [Helianthus annuus]KAJ0482021.1 putative (E)-4-hydroxy-3-methylbut-2-enyl-diphosphate synthase (ferredoxin) [Helianthus annuus]KAJ0498363.1 putative (E)-4-hydroxy-3-methylbut-2-enyl-diphosphate synthase (ferredoxin) [Helianthus annuus]KAJ0664373.1 putative (E)-4-hydroxy-3-methylbut-2-enyl-diphosphate synthase (
MGTRIYCGVFSMKASNPVIMVQAYRLLVAEMYVRGWDYPLHLGVTEAGEGEDGRMKSAIGIGIIEVDYRGVLHRDGSVLMSVSLDQLETPELFYRSLAAKLVLGMPFKILSY